MLFVAFVGFVAAEWVASLPGAPTTCAVGDYAFFTRIGQENKLLVEFEGGGTCWNELTCRSGALYKTDVDVDSTMNGLQQGRGIQDHNNTLNPFQEWTHVYVPYCTGDLHVGDVLPDYDMPHQGWPNTLAVMDWIRQNVQNPSQVMVTGCSAGGFGSHFWAPVIFNEFPEAELFHFGDSGMGVTTQDQMVGTVEMWGLDTFLTQGIVPAYNDLDFTFSSGYAAFMKDIFGMAAEQFPTAQWSTFTSNEDSVQYAFYVAGGEFITPAEWSAGMRSIVDMTLAETAQFASYITPGSAHCIIVSNNFYSATVEGIPLVSWLDAMVTGRPFQREVDCRAEGTC